MLDELNKIRNSNFAQGKTKPTSWTWQADDGRATWQMASENGNGDLAGVEIHAPKNAASGVWTQAFRPKKDQDYRIEAVVSCDCKPQSASEEGGLLLVIQAFDADGEAQETVFTPAMHEAHEYTIRAYYKTPPGTRRIELRVGLVRAHGSAAVHDVRVVPVLELDAKSHPWAIPALPYANPVPVRVRKVCVVTDQPHRPVVDLLHTRFGKAGIRTCSSRGFRTAVRDADAVIIAGDQPPASCRTMDALRTLAQNRIVIVSLTAMEVISGEHLVTRTIRQIDDPLHARVRYADFVTNGFALYDILPFAGRSDHSTAMVQRQFRVNDVFRKFCEKNKLDLLLESETDSDVTSRKPVALFGRTSGGAIIVMDMEPVEAVGSSLDEPVAAAQLLMSCLGASAPTLGQYSAAARDASEFNSHIRDMVNRFPELAFASGTAPTDPESPYLITVGRELDSVGLPLVPRPMLLIRTCLRGDDLIGAYSVMLWLKQLLRKAPFDSPYAKTLASVFRIAWMPLAAPIQKWGGWRNHNAPDPFPVEIEFDPGAVACVIDITTSRDSTVNLVMPNRDAFMSAVSDTIPTMLRQVVPGGHVRSVSFATCRSSVECATDRPDIETTTDPNRFRQQLHASAAKAGADLLRIEVPGSHSAPFANSVWQTEWIIHSLEQISGMLLGAIVVNRGDKAMTVRPPKRIKNQLRHAVMRKIGEPDRDRAAPKVAGGKVTIPAGHAIVAVDSE